MFYSAGIPRSETHETASWKALRDYSEDVRENQNIQELGVGRGKQVLEISKNYC